MLAQNTVEKYYAILKEELIPAQGCTEPIAIAYAAAKARAVLDAIPERCDIAVSGNIIKNVKSVVVPNTGGLRGIEASAAAGIIAGDADAVLEVVAGIKAEDIPAIRDFLESGRIKVSLAEEKHGNFYIDIMLHKGEKSARVVIAAFHTNIVRIEKNGTVLADNERCPAEAVKTTDRTILNINDIIEFADTADIEPVRDILERQIAYNTAISREGLAHKWGASVGKTILETSGKGVESRAKAAAAAGSDARMSGCELPVVIVSGSGNQGMTASLPVIEYANELNADNDKLLRALMLSDLVTIHQKTGIGRLSAFCGAVSAGCGAASGIAYLYGEGYEAIAHAIVNALAIVSGMVCDGAKPSCAAKIAAAVDAGIFGYEMYKNGNQFYGGDGLVKKGVEKTIESIGRMAHDGMKETDREILKIMLDA